MENQIVENIIKILENEHRMKVKWKDAINKEYDGEFIIRANADEIKFKAEYKREIKKHYLIKIYELKEKYDDLLVLADIIYPDIKDALKNNNINYIDGAGNMYLKAKNFFINIKGNRNEIPEDKYKGRLFGKGGLKIIFAILVNEDLINKPYRVIAEQTETALGTVNYIMKELMTNGYIIFINKNVLKLKNKKDLMNKWITGYEDKLKKTLFIGKFRFNNNKWKNIKFENNKTLWGGEPAAEILTHYLHPQLFIAYTKEDTKELIKKYFLIPDPNGEVEIYKKFWNFDYDAINKNVVQPLLIYADLINTGDDRNLETAKIIYERYLQDKFE